MLILSYKFMNILENLSKKQSLINSNLSLNRSWDYYRDMYVGTKFNVPSENKNANNNASPQGTTDT